jgi:hypothetical protein
MLDQNTTTIITSALTVLGTLGGVVLGVVLSNRYVARQEKAKRNAAVIEEVYSLLTNIFDRSGNNIANDQNFYAGQDDDINRLKTLVHLYLPSMVAPVDNFLKIQDDTGVMALDERKTSIVQLNRYDASLTTAHEALEKLVR